VGWTTNADVHFVKQALKDGTELCAVHGNAFSQQKSINGHGTLLRGHPPLGVSVKSRIGITQE
jgi:hypothetical protein